MEVVRLADSVFMINGLTLDNEEFAFNESLLPCLVMGAQKSGASYLSICLISNLIQTGSKVIFFTAFSMAKEELLKQINQSDIFEVTNENDIKNAPPDKSILVQSGNKDLWQKVLSVVNKLNDYVVFVKNIEEYDRSIIDSLGDNRKILLSGVVGDCVFRKELVKRDWVTKIIFDPANEFNINLPILEKYESFLINQNYQGVLRLTK